MPFLLKGLLVALLVYATNTIHFPTSLGVPGLNILNLLCLVIWLLHLQTHRPNDVKPLLRKRFFALFLVITIAFLITLITLPDDMADDLNTYKTAIFYPLLYFFFFYVVRTEEDARLVLYVIMAVATLAGLEAIREGLDYGNTTFHPMKRASGPFGEDARAANRAGVFYAMFIAMALAIALYNPEPGKPWIRLAGIGAGVVMASGMFFTFSRQAYLISAIVAALMMVRRGPAVIIILVIGVYNYDLWVPQAAVDRMTETQQVDEAGVEGYDDSTESRWVQWAAGWRMIQDQPWGIGLGRFRWLSERYGGIERLDAHNHYVLFAAEAGPHALVVHIVLVISLMLMGRKVDRLAKRQGNPFGRTLGTGFFFTSLAMILGNIYGSPFANGEVMVLYWALAALCARQLVLLQQPAQAPAQPVVPEADTPALAPPEDVPLGARMPRRVRQRSTDRVPKPA